MDITDQLVIRYEALCNSVPDLDDELAQVQAQINASREGLAATTRAAFSSDVDFAVAAKLRRHSLEQLLKYQRQLKRRQHKLHGTNRNRHDELQWIGSMEGVKSIRVRTAPGRLQVSASVVYRFGVTQYDFGDWNLSVYPQQGALRAFETRVGYFDFQNPPVYRIGTDMFCFGENEDLVNQLVAEHLYPEAISMALSYIGSVNRGDEYLIPQYYTQIGDLSGRQLLGSSRAV